MKIKLNIDKTPHKEKPKRAEIGAIRNRLANGAAEIDTQELIALIENGGTFTPALMNGTSGDSWQSQQVIVADIDNDNEKPLSSERAAALCAAAGIDPFCIYRTFSNSDQREKYRIVLILEETITDKAEAEEITARFAHLFNSIAPGAADTTMADAARLIFGSYKGSIIINSKSITPLEVVRALPEIQQARTAPAPRQEPPAKYEAPRTARRYEDIKAQRRYDIETFDLYDYVMQTEKPAPREHRSGNSTFLNPCPICGHNDDFVINGPLWNCFGQHGNVGGTIIDYIIHRENKTLQEALQKFDSMMNYEPLPDPAPKEDEPVEYPKDNRDDITKFFDVIQTEAYKPHPTGLKFFDTLLDGGIVNQSLLLLLAAPAAGKTTLVQQIAEEMARNKNRIIYINFEMSREQMLAKAISAKYYRNGGDKTALEVLRGYEWSDEDRAGIELIIGEYRRNNYPYIRYNPAGVTSEINGLLSYLTAVGDRAVAEGKSAPAIVIDYLHLITSNERIDDAELIKQTVVGLKNYAKKYNTFAIGIIASNRASNKSGRLTMESGRDSSNLEYTGDYILSLNYKEIDNGEIKPSSTKEDITEKLEKLYSKKKRPMVLRVLKNRFGMQGKSKQVVFNAPYNIFYDGDDKAIPPVGFILDDGAPAFDD